MKKFFLYTDNEIQNLFDYYTVYSVELFNILKDHPRRVLDPQNADFFMTCFSNEWHFDGNPELKCRGKANIELNFSEIENLCIYKNFGTHYVFYHSDQDSLPDNFINIPYCSFDYNSIIIPAPPLQDLNYLKGDHKRNILASFKGTLNRLSHDGVDYRHEVLQKIKNCNKDVIIDSIQSNNYDYKYLLKNSLFSLVVEGDLAWSYRLCEVINSGSIPIIVQSQHKNSLGDTIIHLPFIQSLDYNQFSFVIDFDSIEYFFLDRIHRISKEEIFECQSKLFNVNELVFKNIKSHVNYLLDQI